jgi:hypothetical protein
MTKIVRVDEDFCPERRFDIFGFSASFIGRWP